MSKHSAGIYPAFAQEDGWASCDSSQLQRAIDAVPKVEVEVKHNPPGEAVLEAYTIRHFKGNPVNSVIIGRLKGSNKRFYATNPFLDSDTLLQTLSGDHPEQTIFVEADPKGTVTRTVNSDCWSSRRRKWMSFRTAINFTKWKETAAY